MTSRLRTIAEEAERQCNSSLEMMVDEKNLPCHK